MNTETSSQVVPAEIVLTSVEGRVFAFVNGEEVANVSDKVGFVTKIEKALRAAHVYRQTGYDTEAGALIATGQMVVA